MVRTCAKACIKRSVITLDASRCCGCFNQSKCSSDDENSVSENGALSGSCYGGVILRIEIKIEDRLEYFQTYSHSQISVLNSLECCRTLFIIFWIKLV